MIVNLSFDELDECENIFPFTLPLTHVDLHDILWMFMWFSIINLNVYREIFTISQHSHLQHHLHVWNVLKKGVEWEVEWIFNFDLSALKLFHNYFESMQHSHMRKDSKLFTELNMQRNLDKFLGFYSFYWMKFLSCGHLKRNQVES